MNTITVDQKIPFTIAFVDSAGNPARVDGPVAVETSDPAVATIENLAADGLSGEVIAQAVGTVQVRATGDADLGGGVRPVLLTGDVEVVSGEAVAGSISFGAAVPK